VIHINRTASSRLLSSGFCSSGGIKSFSGSFKFSFQRPNANISHRQIICSARRVKKNSIKESQEQKGRKNKRHMIAKVYHEKTSPLSEIRHIHYPRRQTFSAKPVQGKI
jgi:hypothetical protein